MKTPPKKRAQALASYYRHKAERIAARKRRRVERKAEGPAFMAAEAKRTREYRAKRRAEAKAAGPLTCGIHEGLPLACPVCAELVPEIVSDAHLEIDAVFLSPETRALLAAGPRKRHAETGDGACSVRRAS